MRGKQHNMCTKPTLAKHGGAALTPKQIQQHLHKRLLPLRQTHHTLWGRMSPAHHDEAAAAPAGSRRSRSPCNRTTQHTRDALRYFWSQEHQARPNPRHWPAVTRLLCWVWDPHDRADMPPPTDNPPKKGKLLSSPSTSHPSTPHSLHHQTRADHSPKCDQHVQHQSHFAAAITS